MGKKRYQESGVRRSGFRLSLSRGTTEGGDVAIWGKAACHWWVGNPPYLPQRFLQKGEISSPQHENY